MNMIVLLRRYFPKSLERRFIVSSTQQLMNKFKLAKQLKVDEMIIKFHWEDGK